MKMPIFQITRLISSSTSTFIALDRATAIAEAKANSGTHATNVGRVAQQWPQLLPYTNDNSGSDFTKASPEYIWDSFTTTPPNQIFRFRR